jgi:hypothetical protein
MTDGKRDRFPVAASPDGQPGPEGDSTAYCAGEHSRASARRTVEVTVRTITDEQRRARLGRRHALARPVRSVERAASAVVALHSSDPTSVVLSARARIAGFGVDAFERALYDDRSLVRMLGMRRTLFVIPRDLAGTMQAACTDALVAAERKRLVGMLTEQGVAADAAAWLRRVCRKTFAALEERGEATARELTADVPELGEKLLFGAGKRWEATVGVSTRVLFLLATEGAILRTRPLGGWTSGQYRWAPVDRWLGTPLERPERAAACAEVLGRYLAAFGPATHADLRWWTGWTARLVTTTLEAIGAVEVALEGGAGFVTADDDRAVRRPEPWVALLPCLDPTVMGWKQRAWFLGDHADAVFDRNGNAGATVWADGRIVGGWAQTREGEIAVELLEPVSAATRKRIDAERRRLRSWLGDVRFRSRFPSPLERSLRG